MNNILKQQQILDNEKNKTLIIFDNLNTSFDFLQILIASPNNIRFWSEREIKSKNDIIKIGKIICSKGFDFQTFKPECDGIFCEKIFGPIKNWKCTCGKYDGSFLNTICKDCLVEFTETRVRTYRMGFIELNYPLIHSWYSNINNNYIFNLLKLLNPIFTEKQFENIISFNYNIEKSIYLFKKKNELINIINLNTILFYGNEIIKLGLEILNLNFEIIKLRSFLKNLNKIDQINVIQNLRIIESFINAKINPNWMLLINLPVLPPNLRPLLKINDKQVISSILNSYYEQIILLNNQLIYSDILSTDIVKNCKKYLQININLLFGQTKNKMKCNSNIDNINVNNLIYLLEGKYGLFRLNILGKRLDFSGRSSICSDPLLRLNQCGLPYEIISEILNFSLLNIIQQNITYNLPFFLKKIFFKYTVENNIFIFILCGFFIQKFFILLNRAPTLHKLNLQSFIPILVIDQLIHLHPLLCTAYNADFDGDQMAFYIPLLETSQIEIRKFMQPYLNIISLSSGTIIIKPVQDIIIGFYYLTLMFKNINFKKIYIFKHIFDVLNTWYIKKISLHTSIFIKYLISDFKIQKKNNKYFIHIINNNLFIYKKTITISNIFIYKNIRNRYCFFTNIGIFICTKINNNYQINIILLETTPGRLLITLLIKNFNKNYVYKSSNN